MKFLKNVLKESEKVLEVIFEKHFNKKGIPLEIEDAVRLGFFEDMVRKTDSMYILLEKNRNTSIDMITRNIFEGYVYYQLLFQRDNRLYARSYVASQKMRDLMLLESLVSESKNGDKIRTLLGKTINEINDDISIRNSLKQLKKEEDNFSDVFLERSKNKKWYNLDGRTKNFEQLCNKINLYAEYELVYRILSKEVHSLDIMKRWQF